jgi:hypothetical protein
MTPEATASDPSNFGLVDRFTVAHISAGALLGFTKLPLWAILGLTVAFEVVEPHMQSMFPQWRMSSTRETQQNMFSDVLVAVAAAWLVRKLP